MQQHFSKKSLCSSTSSPDVLQPKILQSQRLPERKVLVPIEILQKARKVTESADNQNHSEAKKDLRVKLENLNLIKLETRSSGNSHKISLAKEESHFKHQSIKNSYPCSARLSTLNDLNEEVYVKRLGRGGSFENSLRPTLKKVHHARSKSITKMRTEEDVLDIPGSNASNKSFRKPERLSTDTDVQKILREEPMRHLKPCRIPLRLKGLPSCSDLPEKEPVKAIEYLVTEGNYEHRPQLRKRIQVHQFSMRNFLNQKIEKAMGPSIRISTLLEEEAVLSSKRHTPLMTEGQSDEKLAGLSSKSSPTSHNHNQRKSAFFENNKINENELRNQPFGRSRTEDERDSGKSHKQNFAFLKMPTTDRSRVVQQNQTKNLKRAQSGDLIPERDLKCFKPAELSPLRLKIRRRKIFNPFSEEEIYNEEHQAPVTEADKSKERKITPKRLIAKLIKSLRKMRKLKLTPQDILDSQTLFSSDRFKNEDMLELTKAAKWGRAEKVQEILENKGKYLVYGYDELYETALHWAAKRNYPDVAKILIEHGADVDAKDIVGRTPLYFAIKNNSIATLRLLLANQAEPWANDDFNYKELCGKNTVALYYVTRAQQLSALLKMAPSYRWSNQGMNLLLGPEMEPTEENIIEILGKNSKKFFNSSLRPRIFMRQ